MTSLERWLGQSHTYLTWLCAIGIVALASAANAAATSSRFGLLPTEIGQLQTPSERGDQLFSSPVSVADHNETNVRIFATGRYWEDSPSEPTAYLGAIIFIPFVAEADTAWLSGIGVGIGNPTFGLFRAEGATNPTRLSPQSTESLDLRTTLNSRPHPRLNIALGLRSLAKLVGTIDVRVADAGNETYVINRLLTSFRPEFEARWLGHGWALQTGYRHRLLVDYDVPLRAALEDPVPLDLPELAIRGVAFIEPSALWFSGYQHDGSRSWSWRFQLELPDAQSVGLSGLTPTESRPLPATKRRWSASLSNQSRKQSESSWRLDYAAGVSHSESEPMTQLKLRLASGARYQTLGETYGLGCAGEIRSSRFTLETIVCSFSLATDWEKTP